MITQEKKIAIAKRLAALPADKQSALTERLAAEGIDVWQLPIVSAVPETEKEAAEHYPLSFAQQRLWFIDQLAHTELSTEAEESHQRAQYNLFFGLQFHGELRVDWLQTAFNEIVRRHDVLRMQIIAQDGVGKQRIRPFEAFSIEQITLPATAATHSGQSSTEQALQRLAQQQSSQIFDLANDPLYRFTLVKVNSQHQVGLFTVHHLVFDAWSIDNLVQELSLCYQALANNQEVQLPELSIQYQDFATWQRRWAQSPAYQQQVNYWQQQLAGAPAQLQLCIEKPAVPSHTQAKGQELSLSFSPALSEALNNLAQQQGTTLYITLLAAFNLLLARYQTSANQNSSYENSANEKNQSDICIGTSIANRPRLETEPLLGYFVNTLVMRNQLVPQQRFSDFLQQVNEVATQAYANQDLPFDHLLELLQVDRKSARSPLFQVMFVMNNGAGNNELQLPGVTLRGFEKPLEHARFDLTLRVTPNAPAPDTNPETNSATNPATKSEKSSQSIRCDIEFNLELFHPDDITQLLHHYEQLISQICALPEQPLAQFSLLSDQQSQALVQQINPPVPPRSALFSSVGDCAESVPHAHHSVQAQFEHWADKTPNALALVGSQGQRNGPRNGQSNENAVSQSDAALYQNPNYKELTYGELNRRANQLAHLLNTRLQNTQQETRIALLLDRSSHLIVAMLAVLKTGSAYVPLDIKWPASRIHKILNNCQASLVISDTTSADSLQSAAAIQDKLASKLVLLDSKDTQATLAQQSPHNVAPPAGFTIRSAAYLIYTSGSTGEPKGVVVEHQQLLGYANGVMARITERPNTKTETDADTNTNKAAQRFASISTVAADLGNTSIYGALLFGGSLHLVDSERAFDAEAVANDMSGNNKKERRIEVLKIVPSHLRGLLSSLAAEPQQQARLLPAKTLILGGEASDANLIATVRKLAPSLRIINHYGPTETTVGALSYSLNASDDAFPGSSQSSCATLPIGKPLPGYAALVLDEQQNLCPPSIPGELYIGGAGVARGYFTDADDAQAQESNRQKFISVPDKLLSLIEPLSASNASQHTMQNRWYRTGDKVRVLPGGDIEFIGRLDNQVKIRGFRVDLGDIEAAIDQTLGTPAFTSQLVSQVASQAAVLLVENRLVAFISGFVSGSVSSSVSGLVTADTRVTDTSEFSAQLNAALVAQVPAHMVPQQYVLLETLPLTHNGKLDRNALVKLAQHQTDPFGKTQSGKTQSGKALSQKPEDSEQQAQWSQPEIEQQQLLADIWCQVLRKDTVSIHDSFFNIGGDSILSLQVIARTKKAGYRLFPKQLFNHPTIAELAELMVPLADKKPKKDQQNTQSETNTQKHAEKRESQAEHHTILPAILPAPTNAAIPLSFSQQRLWFLDQLQGSNSIYNMPMAVQLRGELSKTLLEQSFAHLLERHDGLRTRFTSEAGVPMQIIATPAEFQAHFTLNWQTVENAAQAQQRVQNFARQPFELNALNTEQQALFRAEVLALPGKTTTAAPIPEPEHWLLVNCHHSIADGWSMGLLVTEFCQIYQALAANQPVKLAPLSIQYSDYAYWQHHSGQDSYQQQLDYWTQQLADAPARLDLPTDFARPAQQSYRGKHLPVQINAQLGAQLQSLATEQNVTLYTLLLAAWQVLLHRYSGQTDICTGSPVANRDLPETQSVVGFFANTIVLRGNLADNPRFCDFVQQMHQVSIDAQANQDVPFEQLVDKLNVARDPSYSPLFQVLFAWGVTQTEVQHSIATPQGNIALSNVPQSAELLGTGTSKFDLELSLRQRSPQANENMSQADSEPHQTAANGIEGRLEFASDLFDISSIERLWQHFTQLLQNIVANPAQTVGSIALITQPELEQLAHWNSTSVEAVPDFLQQFHSNVSQLGDQVAVCFEDVKRANSTEASSTKTNSTKTNSKQTLTYAELNEKSTLLAQHLVNSGVKVGDKVTLCQRRSLNMLVSLLAVLKAGAAYVPVDPNYPASRVQFMLQDANSQVILTDSQVQNSGLFSHCSAFDHGCESDQIQTLAVDAFFEQASISFASISNVPLPSHIDESELAYMIYTSGSTGTPKAVQITRGNLNNFLYAMASKLGTKSSDKLLAVTSLSFDIAALELFLPLAKGAQVVLGHESLSLDGTALKHMLFEHQISIMQATPVSWKMLLAADWQQTTPLTVLCGGEAFPAELAQQLLAQTHLSIWNMYGPTETTVWSAMYPLRTGAGSTLSSSQESKSKESLSEQLTTTIPIGSPIANTQIYIVSDIASSQIESSQIKSSAAVATLSPVGVAGELCIAGAGLAAGYLGRDDLTAEKFIEVSIPSAQNHGMERVLLYRTGDLARYQPDGTLVCLGRVDQQVKVRGFRIEPGEIEARLAEHQHIAAAAVSVQEHQGASVLVAWVTLASSAQLKPLAEPTPAELQQHLRQHLPDYMLPSGFMILDALPLTPNGKVDKKALPKLDFSANSGGKEHVAPRTDTETALAGIWQALLGLETISVEDNFFELGGHSLLAARLRASIETELERDISLMDLFSHQTIASLATLIDQTDTQFALDDVDWMASLLDQMEEE